MKLFNIPKRKLSEKYKRFLKYKKFYLKKQKKKKWRRNTSGLGLSFRFYFRNSKRTLIPRFLIKKNINIVTLYSFLKKELLQRNVVIPNHLFFQAKTLKKLRNKILSQKPVQKFSAENFFKNDFNKWKTINFPKKIQLLQQIKSTLRFILPAKLADTGPPTGPMLGQYNVPLTDFCQNFLITLVIIYRKGVPLTCLC